jgi:hypothetical protein
MTNVFTPAPGAAPAAACFDRTRAVLYTVTAVKTARATCASCRARCAVPIGGIALSEGGHPGRERMKLSLKGSLGRHSLSGLGNPGERPDASWLSFYDGVGALAGAYRGPGGPDAGRGQARLADR